MQNWSPKNYHSCVSLNDNERRLLPEDNANYVNFASSQGTSVGCYSLGSSNLRFVYILF
jgi:hypothetical protein